MRMWKSLNSFTFIGCVNWHDHLESNTATASKAEGEHTLQSSNSVSNIFLRETHTLGKRDCSDSSSKKLYIYKKRDKRIMVYSY